MSEWDEFRKAVGEGLKGKVDTKFNNVVNIEDGTPFDPRTMPVKDDWYELFIQEQQKNDDLTRILANQTQDNKFLEGRVEQLERDKKELQEQLQKKGGWGKWINYKK